MTIGQIRDAWDVLRGRSRAIPNGPGVHLAITANGDLFGRALIPSGMTHTETTRAISTLTRSAQRRIEMEMGHR